MEVGKRPRWRKSADQRIAVSLCVMGSGSGRQDSPLAVAGRCDSALIPAEEMVKHRGMVSDPNERYFELRRGAAAAPFVDQWFTTSVSGPSACSMAPDSRCIDEEGCPLWKCEWKNCEDTRLQPTGTWMRNNVTRHVHKFNFALSLPFCGPPTPMGLYC